MFLIYYSITYFTIKYFNTNKKKYHNLPNKLIFLSILSNKSSSNTDFYTPPPLALRVIIFK